MKIHFSGLLLILSVNYLSGQCLTDLRKIEPERNSREFGYQVALNGNYMVVSNNADDTLGYTSSGGAYLYKKSPAGWNFLALLKPSNPVSYLQFGYQVRIDSLGETVAVSSYGYNDGVNNVLARSDVYIFQKPAGGWTTMTETERIAVPDSLFSITSIDLSNDGRRVIAGKYYTDKNETGKVYVYSRNNLSEKFSSKIPLTLISPVGSTSFGNAVAMDKHYLAIASDYYNGNYGVIFVYKFVSDTIQPIAQLKTRPNSGFSTWRQIVFKDNIIVQTGQSPSTALFVYVKPTGLDWKNANETAVLTLMDSTKVNLGSTAAVQVLDSLNIGVVSMYLNSAVMNGLSPTGYFEVFNKPVGANWAHATPSVVLEEKLPVNGFYSTYGSSASWNGKDFAFTPSLDAEGSHFINSITTITKSNGVWGSEIKTRVPRLNSSNHYYGQSIASRGNVLLVGDPHDSEAGPNSGAVYIYGQQSGNWVKKNKIVPVWESMTDTFFGGSVSLTDSILAIGALNYGQSGRVYIYQKVDSSWNAKLVQQIDSPATGIYQFGDQVAISSKLLVVSAFNANGVNGTSNTFIVYEKSSLGWRLSQVVDVHNAWLHYQTMRLDIRNDSLFVYTGLGGYSGTGTGLYIYAKNNSGQWVPTSTFVVPQNVSSFDVSFTQSENQLFMGLPGATVMGKPNVGAVVVYTKTSGKPWPNGFIYQSNILYPNDTVANGYFGYSVSTIENTLVVGAPGTDYVTDNLNVRFRNKSGATYVFTSQDYYWKSASQLLKLQGTQYNEPLSDYMGWSVVADYNYYFSSARFETNDRGSLAGAVYTIPTPPLVKLMAPVCSQSAPLKLFGYPFGGTWSGPGLVSGSNGTFDPQLVGTGKYLLTYKTPNCTYEGKLQIEVRPSPSVTLASANAISICPANPQKIAVTPLDSATYQWYYQSFSNNSLIAISGQTNPEITVGLSGYYYCYVTKNGCSTASPLVTVNYETPSTSIGPQEVVCAINNTISLKASPSGGVWKGTGVSNESSGTFSPSGLVNGKYPITYSFTSQLGCKYSLADTVLVDTIPQIKLSRVPGDFCLSGLVTLQAMPLVKHLKYQWKFKSNLPSATWLDVDTISLPKRNFIESGFYESVVSNSHCQAKSDSIEVGLLNDLPLDLSPKDSVVQVCLDPTVKLTVSSNRNDVSFAWYSSDSVNSAFNKIGEGESISVSHNGYFKVKGEVGFCESESKIKYVKFLPHDSIWVPNVFTPNGDALNPDFKIWSNVNSYSLLILNRWGQEVFKANQNNKPWDGEDHPTGTYYWFIQFRNCKNEQKTAQGFVQIVR